MARRTHFTSQFPQDNHSCCQLTSSSYLQGHQAHNWCSCIPSRNHSHVKQINQIQFLNKINLLKIFTTSRIAGDKPLPAEVTTAISWHKDACRGHKMPNHPWGEHSQELQPNCCSLASQLSSAWCYKCPIWSCVALHLLLVLRSFTQKPHLKGNALLSPGLLISSSS